jgi:hypothetical protein
MTTTDFINAVGSQAIQDAVGVKEKAVQSAQYANQFPARWYYALRKLAYDKNVELDIMLFNWKVV